MTSTRIEQVARQSDHATVTVRPSASLKRLTDLAILAVALVIVTGVLYLLSDVILILFAAILFAAQLVGMSRFVQRHTHLPYGLSLTAVILGIVAAVGLFSWWHGPDVINQLGEITVQAKAQLDSLWSRLSNIDALKNILEKLRDYTSHIGSHLAGHAAGLVTSTLGLAGTMVLIVVAGIYFAVSPTLYRNGAVALMPHRWRRHGGYVLDQEGTTLRWWFIGQLADMAAIGILTAVGLFFLGVKLWIMLALIAALCNFVPYIGALMGSVPAILVALAGGPMLALEVALLFIVVQSLEGNLISPLIQKRTVDLPPIVTLLSQTVLGTLFGPMGLILATPVVAGSLILVKLVYQEKILGDHMEHTIKHEAAVTPLAEGVVAR